MIKIQTLTIEDFRGIRKLKLDIGCKTFAIYGPNGTGKSGVVDALEFVITGNITRLTGGGTSGINIKTHAPHVDQRDAPHKARVILEAYVPSLNKSFTIERRVSAPNRPIITPDDPELKKVVDELERHPEFALTRREIIKYVLAAPGERAKEVQALLRLEEIEKVRQSLSSIETAAKKDAKRDEQEVNQAQKLLLSALGLGALKRDEVLKAVNQRRCLLGLEELTELGANTSLKLGLGGSGSGIPKSKVPKKQAVSEVSSLIELLATAEPSALVEQKQRLSALFRNLLDSPALLRSLKRESFLRNGLDLLDEENCPFCDDDWELTNLRRHVDTKLAEAKEALRLKDALLEGAKPVIAAFRDLETLATTVTEYSKQLVPPLTLEAVVNWIESLKVRRNKTTALDNIEINIENLSSECGLHPASVMTELCGLREKLSELPDASQEDEAKEYLTLCQERLEVYREAKRQQDRNNKQCELAGKVLSSFSESANAVLASIYENVQQDFSKFYQFINREDEASFTGTLTPSLGKLGFDVDFYGRGSFPPGAYHSEGHQDSMGICLYLALMRHTLGKQFTFAVLDDVLMSVDSGHRREVCALLKSQFPDTQFIVTTHDEIWLNHMRTEQLITSKSCIQFRKWTVEDGPTVWEGSEAWDQIKEELEHNNVSGAAQILRRYLEYISAQLSGKLRVNIEFRGDAQYDLGELLPAVIKGWNELMSRAQVSAQSWSNKEETARLSQRQKEFSEKVNQSNVEQWSINKSIHYNEWLNLGKEDFLPVVTAFEELLEQFRCPNCLGFIYVTPSKGQAEGLRCDCGSVNINLKKRAKDSAPKH